MQNRIFRRTTIVQRLLAAICLAASLFGATIASPVQAITNELSGPTGSVKFGSGVYALPNGNIVITDPEFGEAGKILIGAVYLYNGETRALISRMTGSQDGDTVGSGGVIVLNDGNFLVNSPAWANGSTANASALTRCSATTGCPATVTTGNSLVGTHDGDNVGGTIDVLAGSAFIASSTSWDNFKGSITYCNSGAACAGQAVSSANSLVGSVGSSVNNRGDNIGYVIQVLPDGSYVSYTPYWNKGAAAGSAYGAVVGCPSTGCSGVVSTTNSLYGTTLSDTVGSSVTPLGGGSFVVNSSTWHDGSGYAVGAVTYCASVTDPNCYGQAVSKTNSLTGNLDNNAVGSNGVAALSDGNYVVRSPQWTVAGMTTIGAATFCSVSSGASACTGQEVTNTNSLVGSHAGDMVGGVVVALPNGAYVVDSSAWDSYKGAVTFCSSGAACNGEIVSSANSLVGTNSGLDAASGDQIGNNGITVLSGGGYLVASRFWANGSIGKAGAVTYCPSTGCTGALNASSSLVGDKTGGMVGSGGVMELASGAYIVMSSVWSDGVITPTYAATFCSSTAACNGTTVSTTNSLVGSRFGDEFDSNFLSAIVLSNGNFLIGTPYWSNGSAITAGALTFCTPSGCTGAVTTTNSLVGGTDGDGVGSFFEEVGDGFYVVPVGTWSAGSDISDTNVGAVALCSIVIGCTGTISNTFSVLGQAADDGLSLSDAYDAVHHNLIVGWPTQNKVTFFNYLVRKATSVALSSSAPGNTSTYGSNVTFTATVTATGGIVPTGQVAFLDNQTALCSNVAVSNGVATCTKSNISAGTHLSITTHFTGTGVFSDSVSSALSLTVQKAILTVKANDATRAYGVANPAFSASLSGFKNGETLGTSGVTGSASCTSPATPSSPVAGSPYAINCTQGSLASGNYTFTFVSGLLTVTRASAVITLGNLSLYWDGTPKPITVTTSPAGLTVTVTYTGIQGTVYGPSQVAPVGQGNYTVTASINNANYLPSAKSGKLTIWKRVFVPIVRKP